eukprot:UN30740
MRITSVNISKWRSHVFATPFATDNVSVITMIQNFSGEDYVQTRIRNISRTGFEITLEAFETSKGSNWTETIAFIAATPGVHKFTGITFEFGQTEVAETQTTILFENQGNQDVGKYFFSQVASSNEE